MSEADCSARQRKAPHAPFIHCRLPAPVQNMSDDVIFSALARLTGCAPDIGRAVGTIAAFAGDGSRGPLRGIVGCANAAQTRAVLSFRHIEFSIVREDADATIDDLGRPWDDAWRPELVNVDGVLLDAASGRAFQHGQWRPYRRRCPVPNAPLCSAVPIGGSRVTFPHGVERVFYGARPILDYEGSLRTGTYYDGLLVVAHVASDGARAWVTTAEWRPDWESARHVQRYHWSPACDVYAMIGWRGGVWFADGAMSGGDGSLRLFRASREGLKALASHPPAPGGGNEAYGMTVMHDALLIGHYPSGLVLRFDGRRLAPLRYGEDISQLLGVGAHAFAYGEAQTLALYGGRLWVGHYPWGYLLDADPELSRWRARPLFRGPEPAPNSAPYRPRVAERIAAREAQGAPARTHDFFEEMWSRRVHSAAFHDHALALGLASRRGAVHDPARDDFIDAAELADYGGVRLLRAPNTIVAPMPWPAGDVCTVEAQADSRCMRLFVDGVELGAVAHDLSAEELRGLSLRSVGDGLFGRSELSAQVTHGKDTRAGPRQTVDAAPLASPLA